MDSCLIQMWPFHSTPAGMQSSYGQSVEKKKKEKKDTAIGDLTDVNGNSHSTEGLNGDTIIVVKLFNYLFVYTCFIDYVIGDVFSMMVYFAFIK